MINDRQPGYISHANLILIMENLGYDSAYLRDKDDELAGVCYGFTQAWVQAVLTGQEKKFFARIDLIVNTPNIKKRITEISEKRKNQEALTSEDLQYIDVIAFMDDIFLQQVKREGRAKKILPGVSIDDVPQLLASLDLEAKGGSQSIYSFPLMGNEETISHYFENLKELLKAAKLRSDDIAITLSNRGHIIGIKYDDVNDKLVLIDSNQLPAKDLTANSLMTLTAKPNEIFSGKINKDTLCGFQVEILTTGDKVKVIEPIFDKFKKENPLTDKMALSKTYDSRDTPAHFAALYDDVKSLQELAGLDAIEEYNLFGELPIHKAALKGKIAALDTLSNLGISLEARTFGGQRPIHMAALGADINVLEYLKSKKVDLTCLDREGMSPIHFAIRIGDKEVITWFLNNGVDINKQYQSGETLLHYAVKNGNIDVIEFLIKNGANLHQLSDQGKSVLHLAAEKGHIKVFQYLVNLGCDPHVIDHKGMTLAHSVASSKNIASAVDFLAMLSDLGVDLHQTDHLNQTLVHYATNNNNIAMLKYLLSQGFDFNKPDSKGILPAHIIVNSRDKDLLQFFISQVPNVEWFRNDISGRSPMFFIVDFMADNLEMFTNVENFPWNKLTAYVETLAKKEKLNALKVLLEQGVNLNIQTTNSGNIANIVTAKREINEDIIKFLLANVKDINWNQEHDGKYPLYYIAKRNSQILSLFENISGINWQVLSKPTNKKSDTLAHDAVKKGDIVLLQQLVRHGISVETPNNKNETPLAKALNSDDVDILLFLMQNSPNTKNQLINSEAAIVQIARRYPHELIKFTQINSIDWSQKSLSGHSILKILVDALQSDEYKKNENSEKSKDILAAIAFVAKQQGVDVNEKFSGKTIAHLAASRGPYGLGILNAIVARGIDPNNNCFNSIDETGKTPLHYFCQILSYAPLLDVYDKVLRSITSSPGINLNVVDQDGHTPLHLVANQPKIINFLANQGADLMLRNLEGQTMLHFAKGNPEIINIIATKIPNFDINQIDYLGRNPAFITADARMEGLFSSDEILEEELKFLQSQGANLLQAACVGVYYNNQNVISALGEIGVDLELAAAIGKSKEFKNLFELMIKIVTFPDHNDDIKQIKLVAQQQFQQTMDEYVGDLATRLKRMADCFNELDRVFKGVVHDSTNKETLKKSSYIKLNLLANTENKQPKVEMKEVIETPKPRDDSYQPH